MNTLIDLWNEMMAVERRLDDVFRAALGGRARTMFHELPGALAKPFAPSTDIYRRNGDVVVRIELPGIDPKKDVSVTLENDEMIVRGERTHETEVKEDDYVRMESWYGSFERHLAVPEGLDENAVKADYHDGFLTITVPAVKEAKPAKTKKIPIETAR